MFIQRFEELLKETNTNKATVAAKTGIPLETICNWFNRNSCPSVDKVARIADFFEVSVDYLLGRQSDIGIVEVQHELTADQEEMLKIYNRLSSQDKSQLLALAKRFLS